MNFKAPGRLLRVLQAPAAVAGVMSQLLEVKHRRPMDGVAAGADGEMLVLIVEEVRASTVINTQSIHSHRCIGAPTGNAVSSGGGWGNAGASSGGEKADNRCLKFILIVTKAPGLSLMAALDRTGDLLVVGPLHIEISRY